MKIIDKIKKLFSTNDDWIVIKVFLGNWTVLNIDDFGNYYTIEQSLYEVKYNKSKNIYKIKVLGYKPYNHEVYKQAVEYVQELQRKQ